MSTHSRPPLNPNAVIMPKLIQLYANCIGCEVIREESVIRKGDETLALIRYMYHNDLTLEYIIQSLCPKHSRIITDS
jgi:hypothetical protein